MKKLSFIPLFVLLVFAGCIKGTHYPIPVDRSHKAPVISYAGPQSYKTGVAIVNLLPANTGGPVPAVAYAQVSTFAGNGTKGSTDGTGTAASFYNPLYLTIDAAGNVYVGDNGRIRKITPVGVVSTLAGGGDGGCAFADGTGTAARFCFIYGLAVDKAGNVYAAEYGNRIRKITPAGVVSTFAGNGTAATLDGTGTAAGINYPMGLAFDKAGNLYFGEWLTGLLRKITPAGVVTTIAGRKNLIDVTVDGIGTAATFYASKGLAFDAAGNLYVADGLDGLNDKIRKVTPALVVTTIAGQDRGGGHIDGPGASAFFEWPMGMAIDAAGYIYVAEVSNRTIRMIDPTGVVMVSTLAGSLTRGAVNGVGTAATFGEPNGLALDGSGNLYVADRTNYLIRKISLTGYTISPALPAGLSFNSATGSISGTPTATSPATTYTIIARNVYGSSTTTLILSTVAGS